jgi:hypothetical protein
MIRLLQVSPLRLFTTPILSMNLLQMLIRSRRPCRRCLEHVVELQALHHRKDPFALGLLIAFIAHVFGEFEGMINAAMRLSHSGFAGTHFPCATSPSAFEKDSSTLFYSRFWRYGAVILGVRFSPLFPSETTRRHYHGGGSKPVTMSPGRHVPEMLGSSLQWFTRL